MLASKLVVILRPFQVLLTCAAVVFGGLDHNDQTQRIIILAGGISAAVLVLGLTIQTIWYCVKNHETRAPLWVLDFTIFLLLGCSVTAILFTGIDYSKDTELGVPFSLLWLVADSSAALFFLLTSGFLAVEYVRIRKAKPLLKEIAPEYMSSKDEFDTRSGTSANVQQFQSTWGSISEPTAVKDPEAHFKVSQETVVIEQPKSRWSEYSRSWW